MIMFDFFYGNESEQYLFYRVPKILFTDEKFINISCEAKLLYGFLLDRTSLSFKNNWIDKTGIAFVYFKQETAQENLNIGKDKALKIFVELENAGLIIRKKQGQGNPTRIYVMNFAKPVSDDDVVLKKKILSITNGKKKTSTSKGKRKVQTSEKPKSEKNKPKSRLLKNRSQESELTEVKTSENQRYINTEINNTEMSNIYPSIISSLNISPNSGPKSKTDLKDGMMELSYQNCVNYVQEQISYQELLSQGKDRNFLNLVVSLMAEVYSQCKDDDISMNINGVSIPISDIANRFHKIDESHIEYVFEKIDEMSKLQKIKNLRGYVRSCLYNAPVTMEYDTYNQINYYFQNKNY